MRTLLESTKNEINFSWLICPQQSIKLYNVNSTLSSEVFLYHQAICPASRPFLPLIEQRIRCGLSNWMPGCFITYLGGPGMYGPLWGFSRSCVFFLGTIHSQVILLDGCMSVTDRNRLTWDCSFLNSQAHRIMRECANL